MATSPNQGTLTRRDFVKAVSVGIGALQGAAVGGGIIELTGCVAHSSAPPVVSWPIARQVYTTAQQQVCPVALSPSVRQLQAGQAANQLTIIAAHVPIRPQTSLTNTTPAPMWPGPEYTDDYVLNTLHQYPNLILWMAGHRHVNVVTPQPCPTSDPTLGFWEVETCSLRDYPQQFRTFDIRRNADNTVSIIITNVDPAVVPDSPAYKSRGYALGAFRIFGATPEIIADTTSHSYNAELIVQLTPVMQSVIAQAGARIQT